MVNAVININRVTIRDATLSPLVDEFSKYVAGMYMASLVN